MYTIWQQAYLTNHPLRPVAVGEKLGEADLGAQLVVLESAESLGEKVT